MAPLDHHSHSLSLKILGKQQLFVFFVARCLLAYGRERKFAGNCNDTINFLVTIYIIALHYFELLQNCLKSVELGYNCCNLDPRETYISRYLRRRTVQNAPPFRRSRFASYENYQLKVQHFPVISYISCHLVYSVFSIF